MNPAAWALLTMLTGGPLLAHEAGQSAPAAPVAQSGNLPGWLQQLTEVQLSVGAGVRRDAPTAERTTSRTGAFFMWRLRGGADHGFSPAFRVSLTPSKTAIVAAGSATEGLGTLKAWPMLGGVTWKQPLTEVVSLHLAGMLGYSFNRIDRGDRDVHDPLLELDQAIVSISNSFTAETTARLWIEITPRIGVAVSTSFVRARPTVTGTDGRTWKWTADHLRFETGAVFQVWPWKKP